MSWQSIFGVFTEEGRAAIAAQKLEAAKKYAENAMSVSEEDLAHCSSIKVHTSLWNQVLHSQNISQRLSISEDKASELLKLAASNTRSKHREVHIGRHDATECIDVEMGPVTRHILTQDQQGELNMGVVFTPVSGIGGRTKRVVVGHTLSGLGGPIYKRVTR